MLRSRKLKAGFVQHALAIPPRAHSHAPHLITLNSVSAGLLETHTNRLLLLQVLHLKPFRIDAGLGEILQPFAGRKNDAFGEEKIFLAYASEEAAYFHAGGTCGEIGNIVKDLGVKFVRKASITDFSVSEVANGSGIEEVREGVEGRGF